MTPMRSVHNCVPAAGYPAIFELLARSAYSDMPGRCHILQPPVRSRAQKRTKNSSNRHRELGTGAVCTWCRASFQDEAWDAAVRQLLCPGSNFSWHCTSSRGVRLTCSGCQGCWRLLAPGGCRAGASFAAVLLCIGCWRALGA